MITANEAQALLKSREPVLYFSRATVRGSWVKYAYISAIIKRYDPVNKRTELTAEILDMNHRSIVITPLSQLKRISEETSL